MSLYFALSAVENNKNKKSVKFQEDMLIFFYFIQVYVFTIKITTFNILNKYTFQTGSETSGLEKKAQTCIT